MTYTYAIMKVSPSTYEEIKDKLLQAKYFHAIHNEGKDKEVLDMHGIALSEEKE